MKTANHSLPMKTLVADFAVAELANVVAVVAAAAAAVAESIGSDFHGLLYLAVKRSTLLAISSIRQRSISVLRNLCS